MPKVTIVLATYNRPQALAYAIRSALWQTLSDWELLVIGDSCEDETAHVVAQFQDPRIRYMNLKDRFGEQSGPNSVGMALAKSPFIAFLNHDDLWLPDHLERGLEVLESKGGDLYTGSAVFATSHGFKLKPYKLTFVSPADRKIEVTFKRFTPDYFEPISTWIIRRRAIEQVGPFNFAWSLYRTPLDDWLLRFARSGLTHINDNTIVGLKDNSRPRIHRKKVYQERRVALQPEAQRMMRLGAEGYRLWARQEARRNLRKTPVKNRNPAVPSSYDEILSTDDYAHFLDTGEDRFSALFRSRGFVPGWQLKALSRKRMGDDLPEPPSLNDAIAYARSVLEKADA